MRKQGVRIFGVNKVIFCCIFRLSVNISVTCQQNYFGQGCNIFCKNDTNYYCNIDGKKVCLPGMYYRFPRM